jgi:hypothetical protein
MAWLLGSSAALLMRSPVLKRLSARRALFSLRVMDSMMREVDIPY